VLTEQPATVSLPADPTVEALLLSGEITVDAPGATLTVTTSDGRGTEWRQTLTL
jgi:hypothetical protein